MLRRRKHKFYKADGFTMIELLVVIAMVGIIGAIAAPSWQGFLDKQRLNAARSDLMSILKTAQDQAQARQQSQEVAFTSPLSVTVRNASSSTPGVSTRLGEGEVGDKFNLVASTPIVFDNDGRVDVATPYAIKIVNTNNPFDNKLRGHRMSRH